MKLDIGRMEHGQLNLITDVEGVLVGHATVDRDRCHTGVTVVLPHSGNLFTHKVTAASCVFNGFGKTAGLVQVDELGTLETPIALTNTLNVGKVHDALVTWSVEQCAREGLRLTSVNPVVCECNDSRLSDIAARPVGQAEVFAALGTASREFEQGVVGAGRGTLCYGLKGGIGSASRRFDVAGETFTVGVLAQTNYGASADFLPTQLPRDLAESDQGSIILIVATDLPLTCRQLKRVLRRCSVGMARLGSYIGHGSGEIAVGFTTAPRAEQGEGFIALRSLREELMNLPFRAVGEATEEAILQSMLWAKPDETLDGKRIGTLAEKMRPQ